MTSVAPEAVPGIGESPAYRMAAQRKGRAIRQYLKQFRVLVFAIITTSCPLFKINPVSFALLTVRELS